ncbi:hypothetical protein CH371_00910 [Leptospira wolffii]|uniref:Uncharacterized protein n=1 Tax=Leptospira wolffii TaxID=409998 RepID=A0A2M9ZE37_9LEPT|nr:hypothetical protein CH371_00910 [Leptospira wolffii]
MEIGSSKIKKKTIRYIESESTYQCRRPILFLEAFLSSQDFFSPTRHKKEESYLGFRSKNESFFSLRLALL